MEANQDLEKPKEFVPKLKKKLNIRKRGRGIRMTHAERIMMMEKIWEAEIAGFSPTTTCNQLQITPDTYYRLLDKMVEKVEKKSLQKSTQLLTKYFTRQEKALMKSLQYMNEIDDPKAKAELELKRAHTITEAAQFLQSSGLIPKTTEKVEIDGATTYNFIINTKKSK